MTSSLLSRLQSLTEASREIDAEIAEGNGWHELSHDLWRKGEYGDDDIQMTREPPRYTESLDAALMLLPAGCEDWVVARDSARGLGYYASIEAGDMGMAHLGANPAIALLIAIMKAKEESKP